MKTIFLLRHGHAEDQAEMDKLRNLDKEGIEEAKFTGKALTTNGKLPELILSSHANRAYQTAHLVAEAIGYDPDKIIMEQDMYRAEEFDILSIIQGLEENINSVLLAGHNPTMTHAANLFAPDFKENMPTAGCICIEFKAMHWKDVTFGEGKLRFFLNPAEV